METYLRLKAEVELASKKGLQDIVVHGDPRYRIDKILDPLSTPYMFFKWLRQEGEDDQFEVQSKIYAAIPRNTPKPIARVRFSNGEVRAYVMEKIDGEPLLCLVDNGSLKQYLSKFGKTKEDLKSEITQVVYRIRAAGLKHGDLAIRNILLSRQDGRPIFIDPAPYYNDSDGLAGILSEINFSKDR